MILFNNSAKEIFRREVQIPQYFCIHSLELGYEETKEMCWIGKQL